MLKPWYKIKAGRSYAHASMWQYSNGEIGFWCGVQRPIGELALPQKAKKCPRCQAYLRNQRKLMKDMQKFNQERGI